MSYSAALSAWTDNQKLIEWVYSAIALCKPDNVHLCTGSDQEYNTLAKELVEKGCFIPLKKRPHSFLCRSAPSDVARVEEATFICSRSQEEAGPTNHWRDPQEMHSLLQTKFDGTMRGRTMYVIPFCMGPIDSPYSAIGVQISDSAYVVCNMHMMTHVGTQALRRLGTADFVPCMHSVGYPLAPGKQDVGWPCNSEEKYIVHFPEERSIWSYGSGYGGNALLGKKSFALRIASVMGREEGWLAEHMLIMGITNPRGEKKYFAAAFPSACGKTNLAMLVSSLRGWKVECVGDDIAWMHFGKDGRLYAINPESGFFGVAPGTSYASNPHAMKTIEKNAIFTNAALTDDGDVWWEGMTKTPPQHLVDWQGHDWTAESTSKAAHPNARFTVSARQCPIMDPHCESPEGVPISGIIFGGRRSTMVPLVYEAFDWQHGTFIGASVSSEMTAAAFGELGKLRHDPFAMLPFCGYHMGDYFAHWLKLGKRHDPSKLPKIFHVNWFRKDQQGRFLWPGYGENIRVLKWCFERIEGEGLAKKTPIGYVPTQDALYVKGLSLSASALEDLLRVDRDLWRKEAKELEAYFAQFGAKLPAGIREELELLRKRLE